MRGQTIVRSLGSTSITTPPWLLSSFSLRFWCSWPTRARGGSIACDLRRGLHAHRGCCALP